MVKIIDFFNNKDIDLVSGIRISSNDNLHTLKQKIFSSYSLNGSFITPSIMAIGDGQTYIVKDKNFLLFSKILVFNLIDELTKHIIQNIQMFLDVNLNSKNLLDLFNSLSKTYTDLTQEDLVLTIQYILSKHVMFSDLFVFELENWMNKTKLLQEQFIKTFKILDKSVSIDKLKDYIFFTEKNEFVYSIINTVVSFELSKEPLDILKIIKEIKLDNTIPVIMTTHNTKPIIKIYDKFPKDQIKEWVYKDDGELKRVKGLTLKIRAARNNFSTVIISKEIGKLSMRCNWLKEFQTRYKDINKCLSPLNEVVKKINTIFNTNTIRLGEYQISSIHIQFNTKKRISFSSITIALKDFKDIFSLDEEPKKKQFVKLKYIPENLTILIKYSEISKGDMNIKSNIIDVIGIKNEQQILSIINLVGKLFIKADKQKSVIQFKDFEFVEEQDEPVEDLMTKMAKLEIKKLKKKNVEIDTVGCQKQRQPIISNEPPRNSSYALTYKGNRFICPKEPYIYPGFTSKNIVCCFKKDQRDKEVYKRNLNKLPDIIEIEVDDKVVLKLKVITTDKVLEANRLGLLPKELYKIFDNSFLRLGVIQNNLSLLNCLNRATNKNITIDKISNIDYIKEDNIQLSHKQEGDLLSNVFETNIIIFNTVKNVIFCKENDYMPFKNFVFLIKNKKSYEVIVSKQDQTLKKQFALKDDVVEKVLDIYRQSCVIKYSGYPETPLTFVELLNRNVKIKGQIVNEFKKVVYIDTNIGLIPIIPTKPIINVKDTTIASSKLPASKQYKLLLSSSGISYLKPKAQILNKQNETIGIVTNSSLIIPTIPSKKLELPIVYRQFVDNIDNLLFNQVPGIDERFTYNLSKNFYTELYERLKYILSQIILKNKEIKENIKKALEIKYRDSHILVNTLKNIISLILNDEVVFVDKLKPINIPTSRNICSELTKDNCGEDTLCSINQNGKCKLALENKMYNNFINKLAIEIIWNTDILKGEIKREFVGKDNFIKRKDEIVLLTEDEMNKFFN